jgi:bidirectional [NiFe] hydrogenase diaphorase subunit
MLKAIQATFTGSRAEWNMEEHLMPFDFVKPAPPSDDKRWKMVQATMRRNGNRQDALIEALHAVQESFGFLDEDALRYVSAVLRVPLSRTYGVATFYHFFRLKPVGEHTCVVCTGTACYIKGANQLLSSIQQAYGVKPGETTADGRISLLTARCLGACGLAAAVVYDGEVAGRQDADSAIQRLRKWVVQ